MGTLNEDISEQQQVQDLLEEEYQNLLGFTSSVPIEGTVEQRQQQLRARIHGLGDNVAPWALCLSGGGIRSATFSLGVLQQLARLQLLNRFNYLSTVSGGGYIGSWLSRWIATTGGDVQQVEAALAGGAQGAGIPEAPQISQLRAYSDYLSPVRGLSTDFFTLVSIILRNLVLNWLVLLPVVAATLLTPHLYTGLLSTYDGLFRAEWPYVLLAGAGVYLVLGLRYIVADLPEAQSPTSSPANYFTQLCFLPILTAAIFLSAALFHVKNAELGQLAKWGHFCVAGAGIHLLACLAGLRWPRPGVPSRWPGLFDRSLLVSNVLALGLVLGSGVLGGIWVYGVSIWLPGKLNYGPSVYALVTVPALLMVLWMATTIYVALKRKESTEDQREWWARSGGWWIRTSILWALSFCVVVFAPAWIDGFLARHPTYVSGLLAGGGLWGALTGLFGYWSKNGAAINDHARGLAAMIGARVLDLAAAAFILAFLVTLSYFLKDVDELALPLFAVLLVFGWGASWFVGANTFSLHSMYGNRLVRAYFSAARAAEKRHPHWFTGFDTDDNIPMTMLCAATKPEGRRRLFHVVNLALNMVAASGTRLEWQQRKAASFSITPLRAGSAAVGYAPSNSYGGPKGQGISLARAMTISGAAVSPNMGYQSSLPLAFVMTLLNVRLGWWLPNPATSQKLIWQQNDPKRSGLSLLLAEALGLTTADHPYVYLSDGGHFENLGLYEMVRRRCRRILVVDASADPEFNYEDLQNAVRKIRIDLGISIEFDKDSFKAPCGHRIGKIHYNDVDAGAGDGVLCYLKPGLFNDEPLDVLSYAAQSRKNDGAAPFPHQTTADQFFDETQFESYRMLGSHMLAKAFVNPWAEGEDKRNPVERTCLEDVPASSVPSAFEKIANSAHNLSHGAILASAITVGGVIGITGTVALKDTTVSLKSPTEIGINKASLEALRAPLPNGQGGTANLQALVDQLGSLVIVLKATVETAQQTAETQKKVLGLMSQLQELTNALDVRIKGIDSKELTKNLEQLGVVVTELQASLTISQHNAQAVVNAFDKTTPGENVKKYVDGINAQLKVIIDAIRSRNIRGVEGGGK